jgi:hypothetical protein
MIIFPIGLGALFLIVLWQTIGYLRVRQGSPLRKTILFRIGFLFLLIGFLSYAWREALQKETEFLTLLPPYPEARFEILRTPLFSDARYWTYVADATPDEVYNWYRTRSKHAGWVVAEEGTKGGRVFVVMVPVRTSIFVVLEEHQGRTRITYTTEGELMRGVVKE